MEHVRDGNNEFIDERGKISNHELTEPINLIGLIDSKKGAIRANHYHPQQEQKCLFTKGQIIEIFQDNVIFWVTQLANYFLQLKIGFALVIGQCCPF